MLTSNSVTVILTENLPDLSQSVLETTRAAVLYSDLMSEIELKRFLSVPSLTTIHDNVTVSANIISL
jgi:hypothetical protein